MKATKKLARLRAFAIPCSLLVAASVFTPALAQDSGIAPTPVPAPVAMNSELRRDVEAFWHYGKIARYDLAREKGEKVLASGATPLEILQAFEAVAADRKDNLDLWIQRWIGVDAMNEVATRINDTLAEGHRFRRSEPQFIRQHIERLSRGERPYINAIGRLRDSGELAVPLMLDYLRDPSKKEFHSSIRRALADLGRAALNPLTAATEMRDYDTLTLVVIALGELGYDAANPFLSKVVADPNVPDPVKAAAQASLARIGGSMNSASAGDGFLDLSRRFYAGRSPIRPDAGAAVGYVWNWDQNAGLLKKDVPAAIFDDVMAMRCAEYALKLGTGASDEALSLWLSANYRREAELPAGAVDPTRAENQPPAHYYGVSAGASYLNSALDRALQDRNAAVAFKVIRSLHEIGGQSNLIAGGATGPLVRAMQYPDRLVRLEAALAVAQALPQTPFEGSDRVVPILGEALTQSGVPGVLLVIPDQDELNRMVEAFRADGTFTVAGATTAEQAVATALTLPAVDVIVAFQELGDGQVERLIELSTGVSKLQGAARLVVAGSGASVWEQRKVSDPLLSTTQSRDVEGLKPAIEQARTRSGAIPSDPDSSAAYATRAGEALRRIALSRGQVMNLASAKTPLLAALSDPRPNIVVLAGEVLTVLDDREAQSALLARALKEGTEDSVRVSLLKSLASNAKFFGNRLDAGQLEQLQKLVAEAENLDVRGAAAEARGALNLPADQAKALVVQQSRV